MSKIKAGSAYVELTTKNSKLMKGLADAQKRLRAFGAATRMAGLKMFGAGAAIGAPILAAAKLFASAGDQVQKMALRTGVSTEALSTLGFAAEQSGADLGTLERGITKMQRTLGDAASGSQTAIDTLDALGLSVDQLLAMSPEDQFKTLADVIGGIEDPTLKAAAAMRVFGRGGSALLPMLSEGRSGIEALQAEARNLGLEISLDDANLGADLTDSLNRLTRSLKAIPIVIGSAVAPAINAMLKPMTRTVVAVSGWIKNNKNLVVGAAKVAAGLMAAGSVIVAVGAALAGAGMAIGGLMSIIGIASSVIAGIGTVITALLSPIGLVSLAVVGFGAYLLHASGIGGQAIVWLGERFQALKTIATASFIAIGRALAAGDLAAAAKVAWASLNVVWLSGVNSLMGSWVGFKHSALSTTDSMMYGIAGIISDGWAGVEIAWTETTGFLSDVWSLFTNGLSKTWHNTIGFIKKSWVRLKSLFDSDIDVDAEVKLIDGETAGKVAAGDEAMLGAIGKRDQERKARRTEIEQGKTGRAEALAQMQAADESGRKAAGQASIDKAATDLKVAKDEWQTAIDAVAESAEDLADEKPSPLTASIEALKRSLLQSGESVAAEKRSIETGSTFNAFAIRGLGADSLADRQTRAMEQTANNTKKLIKVVEDSSLSFG